MHFVASLTSDLANEGQITAAGLFGRPDQLASDQSISGYAIVTQRDGASAKFHSTRGSEFTIALTPVDGSKGFTATINTATSTSHAMLEEGTVVVFDFNRHGHTERVLLQAIREEGIDDEARETSHLAFANAARSFPNHSFDGWTVSAPGKAGAVWSTEPRSTWGRLAILAR